MSLIANIDPSRMGMNYVQPWGRLIEVVVPILSAPCDSTTSFLLPSGLRMLIAIGSAR